MSEERGLVPSSEQPTTQFVTKEQLSPKQIEDLQSVTLSYLKSYGIAWNEDSVAAASRVMLQDILPRGLAGQHAETLTHAMKIRALAKIGMDRRAQIYNVANPIVEELKGERAGLGFVGPYAIQRELMEQAGRELKNFALEPTIIGTEMIAGLVPLVRKPALERFSRLSLEELKKVIPSVSEAIFTPKNETGRQWSREGNMLRLIHNEIVASALGLSLPVVLIDQLERVHSINIMSLFSEQQVSRIEAELAQKFQIAGEYAPYESTYLRHLILQTRDAMMMAQQRPMPSLQSSREGQRDSLYIRYSDVLMISLPAIEEEQIDVFSPQNTVTINGFVVPTAEVLQRAERQNTAQKYGTLRRDILDKTAFTDAIKKWGEYQRAAAREKSAIEHRKASLHKAQQRLKELRKTKKLTPEEANRALEYLSYHPSATTIKPADIQKLSRLVSADQQYIDTRNELVKVLPNFLQKVRKANNNTFPDRVAVPEDIRELYRGVNKYGYRMLQDRLRVQLARAKGIIASDIFNDADQLVPHIMETLLREDFQRVRTDLNKRLTYAQVSSEFYITNFRVDTKKLLDMVEENIRHRRQKDPNKLHGPARAQLEYIYQVRDDALKEYNLGRKTMFMPRTLYIQSLEKRKRAISAIAVNRRKLHRINSRLKDGSTEWTRQQLQDANTVLAILSAPRIPEYQEQVIFNAIDNFHQIKNFDLIASNGSLPLTAEAQIRFLADLRKRYEQEDTKDREKIKLAPEVESLKARIVRRLGVLIAEVPQIMNTVPNAGELSPFDFWYTIFYKAKMQDTERILNTRASELKEKQPLLQEDMLARAIAQRELQITNLQMEITQLEASPASQQFVRTMEGFGLARAVNQ